MLDGDGVEYSEKVFDTDNSTTDLGPNPFVSLLEMGTGLIAIC